MSEPKKARGLEGVASRAGRLVSDYRVIRDRNAKPERTSEPPFDPKSWTGALVLAAGFAAILWIVEIVNHSQDQRLDRFGLVPRQVHGLWGILTQPFLHSSYSEVFSNTAPVILIGWVLMLSGIRTWLFVTVSVIVLGGAATWIVGPSGHVLVGASGLVFGWMGYLIARAYFSRKIRWILTAVALLVFFGSLLSSLLPSVEKQTAWQAHLCGFVAGALVGWFLHPRQSKSAKSGRMRPVAS